MNNVRKHALKVRWMKAKYFLICLMGKNHESYLRKHQVFGMLGNKVLFQPMKLPNEPKLVKIHNNVKIAADVTFYTHDVINWMLADLDGEYYYGYRAASRSTTMCLLAETPGFWAMSVLVPMP